MSELLKYQRLSELEHVRKRSSVYIGAITNTQRDCWIVDDTQSRMINKTLDYILVYKSCSMKLFRTV